MRKKQLIKSMAIAMAGVLFASCAISASAEGGSVTITGTGTTTLNGGWYTSTPDGGELSTTAIDVQAKTTGGSEIFYYIDIIWGAMQFEYNYGGTWDPDRHVYTGNQTGGWTVDGVDGEKNKITVKNNSNFPMTASFSFQGNETLNANPQAPGSVVGIFSTANTDFKDSDAATTTELLSLGLGGTDVDSKRTARLNLEMDASQLPNNTTYYATNGRVSSNSAASQKNMYFALSGRPDSGVASDLTSVGTISVAISPFATAMQRVTPIT